MGGRGRTRECGSRGISLILMRHMLRDRVYKRPELRLSNLRGNRGAATGCIYTNGSCTQTMFGAAWLALRTDHVWCGLVGSAHRPSNSLEHQRTLSCDSLQYPYQSKRQPNRFPSGSE